MSTGAGMSADQIKRESMAEDIDDKIKPNANTFILALGKLGIEATDDKIVVLEDRFTTGNECRACGGSGESKKLCTLCGGRGEESSGDGYSTPCRVCKGSSFLPCADCNGEGYPKHVILTPEIAMRRPSTGTVVSVGPLVGVRVMEWEDSNGSPVQIEYGSSYNVGDRIIYSNFAGVAIALKQKTVIRIMRSHEILAKLYSVSENFPMGTVLGGGAV